MKSMEAQFEEILKPRLASMQAKAGDKVAGLFEKQMKLNSNQGKGFGNDDYDAEYSESHANARRRKGLQTGRVDLRMKTRRIEQTRVQTTGGSKGKTSIRFNDGGEIFNYHDKGTAKGSKTRSIWPKSPESIPASITNNVKALIAEVLRGKE